MSWQTLAFVQLHFCTCCCCCSCYCNLDCCCTQTATTTTTTAVLAIAVATAKAADKQFAGLWHGHQGRLRHPGRDDHWAWHTIVHLVYEFCFDCKRSAGKCQAIPNRLGRRLLLFSPLCVVIRSDPSGPNNSLAHFSINFTHLNILFAFVFALRITLWLLCLLLFPSTADAH